MSLDANGMPDGLAATLARIQAIQSMTGSAPVGTDAASTGFAQALDDAAGSDAGDTSTTASGATGDAVVADAQKYLGVPYTWGGTDPSTGLDCSGLVQKVFSDLGVSLPRTTYDQVNQGTAVSDLSQAQPGDLLFYGSPPEHVGIYVGNGKMLDAPHSGSQVRVENVWSGITSIRRIVPSTADAAATSATSAAAATSPLPTQSSYASAFDAAGARYGVSSQLLSALAQVESSDNPNAVSAAGAQGLMQLMPSTAASLGVNALDPSQAIDGAARLMSGYLKQFGGSVDEAVAAYNAGPAAVTRYGGVPPYAETQGEVNKVKAILQGVHG